MSLSILQKFTQPRQRHSLLIGAVVFAAAFLVRLPWLWEVPRFIDELKEVELSRQLSTGQIFPLHNAAHDIGAFHNYILAGIFRIFGPSIYWPRLYVAITSALTVLLIFYLGKRLYGPWAGWMAAGLLLTNGMHILVTHMAWANCTTPFFFTMALLATVIAKEERNRRWLAGAAFLWALTLQTHSSVIIYVAVVIIWLLRTERRDKVFDAKDFTLAAWAFGLGYINMILYNLISAGGSIRWLHTKSYTLEHSPGMSSYFANLGAMSTELLRALSSTYANHKFFWEYLAYPFFTLSLALLGIGIYFAVKTGRTLPLWMLIGGFIIMPWINHRYDLFIATRYIMPSVICAMLLMAFGLFNLAKLVGARYSSLKKWAVPAWALFIVVTGMQLVPLYDYCSRMADTNMSNRLSLAIVQTMERMAKKKPALVLLDPELEIENDPLPALFTISNLEYRMLDTFPTNSWRPSATGFNRSKLAVLSESAYQKLHAVLPVVRVHRLQTRRVLNAPRGGRSYLTVYLVDLASN